MTVEYILQPVGVLREEGGTSTLITPANYVAWQEYQAWLASGARPRILPPTSQYATVAEERIEARARLHGIYLRRTFDRSFPAAGHVWRLREDTRAALALMMIRLGTPPAPPPHTTMTLLDALWQPVTLDKNQMKELCDAAAQRLEGLAGNVAAITALIDASPTPLTINLNAGWGA